MVHRQRPPAGQVWARSRPFSPTYIITQLLGSLYQMLRGGNPDGASRSLEGNQGGRMYLTGRQ